MTEEVTRFCLDKKQILEIAGVSGCEREDFLADLQVARIIRHAAVHRFAISEATMNRFSICFQRLSSTAKQIIGPKYDGEYREMVGYMSIGKLVKSPQLIDRKLRWMGSQGWLLHEINCAPLLALRNNSDIGKRMLLEDQALAKTRKEKHKREALESWQAAEARRAKGREQLRIEQQAAEEKRLERQQRNHDQRLRENRKKAERLGRLARSGSIPEAPLRMFGFFDIEILRFTPLG